MATVSRPFEQGDTWRKLGYLYFTNSLSYREVLEQNPQWTVTQLPPTGAQIRVTPSSLSGGEQATFLFGTTSTETEDLIFPFSTSDEYIAALNRYPLESIENKNELNGWSQDDYSVIYG